MASDAPHVIWLDQASRNDVALVGGKNASLGEMIRTLSSKGVRVPGGFATTADGLLAFRRPQRAPLAHHRSPRRSREPGS